jgi:hypothetical protein
MIIAWSDVIHHKWLSADLTRSSIISEMIRTHSVSQSQTQKKEVEGK